MSAVGQPLAPHDRRLRLGRYEVTAHGPARQPGNRRSLISGPHRFATVSTAREYAEAERFDGAALVTITYLRPASSRYPDGPWSATVIDRLEVTA